MNYLKTKIHKKAIIMAKCSNNTEVNKFVNTLKLKKKGIKSILFKLIVQEYVNQYSFLNLFNFITFRVGASILTSLFFSLIFGQFIINKLSRIQPAGQPIRQDGPETHIIQSLELLQCKEF